MKRNRWISLLLAGIMLLALPAAAAETPDAARQEATQAAIEAAAQYGGATSIQFALWEDGEITLTGHAGVYSKTEDRAFANDILYGVGSVSKTYTAAAVLKLAEEGRLDLEDKVCSLLPGFTLADERYRDITVRMLLDHSSGLMGDSTNSAFLFNDPDQQAADRLLERLSTQRLKADPGAYSVYCNDGFTLAELTVEAVTGMDFMDYVRQAILTPAGLTDTFAPQDGFDRARLARTYASAEDDRALPADTLGIVGTGGIYATAADLAAFGGLFCGERILSADSLEAMTTNWAARGVWAEDSASDQLNYGLGWDSVSMFPFGYSGVRALVKGGDTLQYHAGLVVLPDHGKAVAVLSSGGVSTYNQLAGARILIDALAEDGVTVTETGFALPEAVPADLPEAVKEYAGTYASLSAVVTVAFEDGAMTITPAALLGGEAQSYAYYSDGSFRDEGGSTLMKLVPQSNGRVYLYQKGYTEVPGLTALCSANYALERLKPNAVSPGELMAWAERGSKFYLILNEKYTSQLYTLPGGVITGVGVLPEAPGYAALRRIVDAGLAEQYLSLPGSGARNGSDLRAYEKDGAEYLDTGSYLCMEASAAPALWGGLGAYTTVQADGCARWYRVGDLAGRLLRVAVPEEGAFAVYDQYGQPAASSWAWGDTSAVLPENGYVVFSGAPGVRFHLAADL